MSAICQNFVQNAWKKELCSNCFKSKDEHQNLTKKLPLVNSQKVIESIIKNTIKHNTKTKRIVSFTNDIAKVIGYGGEDWSDVDEESNPSEDEDEDEINELDHEIGETEKELERLTKENTDFNTVNANLLKENADAKKSYTHLKLGTPQIDAEGRKQTLMVTVTPFGQDARKTKQISQIPIAKNKDSQIDNKINAILTAYSVKNEEFTVKEEKSLLEEISETLEKGKTPIQIISRKKAQKDIVLDISKLESEKNVEIEVQDKTAEKNKDFKLNKSNIPERKNGLSRATVIKRDQEKPVIYQTSTAKIELSNKNLKLPKELLLNKTLKQDSVNATIIKSEEGPNKSENTEKLLKTIDTNAENSTASDVSLEETILSKDSSDETNSHSSEDYPKTEDSLTESVSEKDESTNFTDSTSDDSIPPETREQAGEPDGHADPDGNNEPPALPTTPPPMLETRSSFLHGVGTPKDKPKPPIKPSAIITRKPVLMPSQPQQQQTFTTFMVEPKVTFEEDSAKLDLYNADLGRSTNKRKAPKPPACEEPVINYPRHSIPGLNIIPSTLKEIPQNDRALSYSSKVPVEINNNPNGAVMPVSRKLLSLSSDSLTTIGIEEKKKEKSKGRFSLKKFLRMNSNKDLSKVRIDSPKYEEVKYVEPQARPRLVIVHPLDLNGAKVEVVSKPILSHEQFDLGFSMPALNSEYQIPRSIPVDHNEQKMTKPLPPPRNLDDWNRKNKPNLPHPPKSMEIINKQKHLNRNNFIRKNNDSVYANIGEVRSAIIPNKPQRTASMREREALAAQQNGINIVDTYEPIENNCKSNKENLYDYISGARSSSPEFDSSSPEKNSPTYKSSKNQRCIRQARSNSNVDVSGEYYKFQGIPRSASLTYCGSETESEIYSPYCFYGSESEVAEDDRDWSAPNSKTYKLRSRKGRSIVHKNLEDNYGAVIIANHEALAQVLENIQQGTPVQPALRGLKSSPNLRWTDFSIKENIVPLIVGARVFHQAVWGAHHVTLIIRPGTAPVSSQSLGVFNLIPITEFTDLVPVKYLPNSTQDVDKLEQASVAVLPWLQINTIQSYTDLLKNKSSNNSQEDLFKDACFIVLQLINALKMLQSRGIEELPLSLNSFIIYREMEKDNHHRLCVLQGFDEELMCKNENVDFGSLCQCAATVLMHLLPNAKSTPLLHSLLNTERAVSLTQVKSILEFSLWGPSDVTLSCNIRERELALQRWLDLQRATVLHGLVCARIQLTVYEECHLLFLVRSNAKMMCDASLLLDSIKQTK
ncbi:hypothetical protein RN001_006276 [Aquatica leii]|uniref:Uncharacterized protein n=1 Tax=Aquatica leii TaxID=1421715 RepID=A0AAN7PD85_9COLE|nr:hypothetical protein RN001_006276 [Aquatica leii]